MGVSMILDFYDFTLEFTYHDVSADDRYVENFITDVRQKEHWTVDVCKFSYAASAEIFGERDCFTATIASFLASHGIFPVGLVGFYSNQVDQIKCKYQNMDIKLNLMQDTTLLQIIYPNDKKIRCYVCGSWDLWSFRSIYLSVLIYTDVRQLLLHGAAIVVQEKGFLLLGTSGAGKTTASSFALSEGHQVLSDESPIILYQDGELKLGGSPWSGSEKRLVGTHDTVHLSAALLLEKDTCDCLVRIDEITAKMKILTQQVYSTEKSDIVFTKKIIGIIRDICEKLPYYTLHFTKSAKFIQVISRQA